MRKFQTISDPALGADWTLNRRRRMIAEMRPVADNESMGPIPAHTTRFDFLCDMRMGQSIRPGIIGSAYGNFEDPPEDGEIVKVNRIAVRVLRVVEMGSYAGKLVHYEVEIERFSE